MSAGLSRKRLPFHSELPGHRMAGDESAQFCDWHGSHRVRHEELHCPILTAGSWSGATCCITRDAASTELGVNYKGACGPHILFRKFLDQSRYTRGVVVVHLMARELSGRIRPYTPLFVCPADHPRGDLRSGRLDLPREQGAWQYSAKAVHGNSADVVRPPYGDHIVRMHTQNAAYAPLTMQYTIASGGQSAMLIGIIPGRRLLTRTCPGLKRPRRDSIFLLKVGEGLRHDRFSLQSGPANMARFGTKM
jgi:hypothetical protein